MGQTSFEENKIIYFSLHIWNQKCSIHYPVLHNQNLVIFTCGFIKFILQENETLHRETVHGLGYDVVTKLVEPFYRKHHHVVVDNGFTSPLLCRDMFDNQTYLTGTVRATRKNMPKSFSWNIAESGVKTQKINQSIFFQFRKLCKFKRCWTWCSKNSCHV